MSTVQTRVVVLTRPTEYEQLLLQHGTRQQVAFFLRTRGRDLDEVDERHERQREAVRIVGSAIPPDWRRGAVTRSDLDRYLFGPEDVVVAVGQDGLVANVAKYLHGQRVVGVNPEPERNPAVLVRHGPGSVGDVLRDLDRRPVEARTMVQATTDDGQVLLGLNEIYVGHSSHQSARYEIRTPSGQTERQSSSGLIVGTGTGATGWLRSAWLERRSGLELPGPTDARLLWFVREAWPSPATGTTLTEGDVNGEGPLTVVSITDHLVAFADGIETDALDLRWGQSCALTLADERLMLVVDA